MSERKTKMTESGVLYVPKDIRDSFGRRMKILAIAKAALFFPETVDYKDVLKSLNLIREELIMKIPDWERWSEVDE